MHLFHDNILAGNGLNGKGIYHVLCGLWRALVGHDVAVPFFCEFVMDWNDFYGVYIEYEYHGVYGYSEVIVDDWHKVMAELDSFVEKSTECFIEAIDEYQKAKELGGDSDLLIKRIADCLLLR